MNLDSRPQAKVKPSDVPEHEALADELGTKLSSLDAELARTSHDDLTAFAQTAPESAKQLLAQINQVRFEEQLGATETSLSTPELESAIAALNDFIDQGGSAAIAFQESLEANEISELQQLVSESAPYLNSREGFALALQEAKADGSDLAREFLQRFGKRQSLEDYIEGLKPGSEHFSRREVERSQTIVSYFDRAFGSQVKEQLKRVEKEQDFLKEYVPDFNPALFQNWKGHNPEDAQRLSQTITDHVDDDGNYDPVLLEALIQPELNSYNNYVQSFDEELPHTYDFAQSSPSSASKSSPGTPDVRAVTLADTPETTHDAPTGNSEQSQSWIEGLTEEKANQLLVQNGEGYTFHLEGEDLQNSRIQHFVGPNAKGPLKNTPLEDTVLVSGDKEYTWNGETWGNENERLLIIDGTTIRVEQADETADAPQEESAASAEASEDEDTTETEAPTEQDQQAREEAAETVLTELDDAVEASGLEGQILSVLKKGGFDAQHAETFQDHLQTQLAESDPKLRDHQVSSVTLSQEGLLPMLKVSYEDELKNRVDRVVFLSPQNPKLNEEGTVDLNNNSNALIHAVLTEDIRKGWLREPADIAVEVEAFERKVDALLLKQLRDFDKTRSKYQRVQAKLDKIRGKQADAFKKEQPERVKKLSDRLERVATRKQTDVIEATLDKQYAALQDTAELSTRMQDSSNAESLFARYEVDPSDTERAMVAKLDQMRQRDIA